MTELHLGKDAARAHPEMAEPEPETAASLEPDVAGVLQGEALLDAWFGPRTTPETDREPAASELLEDLDRADEFDLGIDDDMFFD